MAGTGAAVGLRERKRRRTREAILTAAHDVFAARGYDAATIEEIAEIVEISPRTVFRYFDGKDHLALAWLDDFYGDLRGILASRPTDEPALDSLTAAARGTWRSIDERSPDAYVRWMALAEDSPALLSASLRRAEAEEHRLAEEIARRQGRQADDLEVRALVATFGALLRTASEHWRTSGKPMVPALEQALEECVTRMRAGFF